MNHQDWDTRYQNTARFSSGQPNSTLVAEVAGMPTGQALDVGCGEGGDAIWLAKHGWEVTAIDIAPTALARAARTESDEPRQIKWLQCDIAQEEPPRGSFDLVTMHYIPLLKKDADRVLPRLLHKVARDGTFLFVTHDISELEASNGFDPNLYCQPQDVAKLLPPEWTITTEETRRRNRGAQQGSAHAHDAVLRAARHR